MTTSKRIRLAFSLAGFLLLSACGGDSGSSSDEPAEEGAVPSVETFEDLEHCTKSHYGEIAYVQDEDTYFECTSEDWVEVDSTKLDSILAGSSSSAEGDKPKSSSSLKADSTETAEVETKKVDSVTVTGYAQKGPMASGSAVTVYGLDSALNTTKDKFTGKVSGDSGYFKVEKISLSSQFALVQVAGFYMSEITGKKTSGSKTTLRAVVDLSEGKSAPVNVNLFTELEYARVKHLVTQEKFNVPAAKKRATKELLALFGAESDEFPDDLTATRLNLMDTSAAGKALLSAGVLLQGDRSASKFNSLLSDVGDLFAATGALDSAELQTEMADWASKVDSADGYAAIRNNVKAMKLTSTIPAFENSLYGFWTANYGLGGCTAELEETIKKNGNKLSDNYGAGYACTSNRWHKATALDTELGLCTAKMEGSFKERKTEKESEYYVCRSGTWNEITETQYELKECTEKRESEYVKASSGEYFVCSDKQWLEIDSVSYELKLCTESRKDEIAETKKNGSFVCEWNGTEGAWRKATDLEVELGLCKTSMEDSIVWTGSFFEDVGYGNIPLDTGKTVEGNYYRCHGQEWVETDKLHYIFGATCEKGKKYIDHSSWISEDGVMINVVADTSNAVFKRFFDPADDATAIFGSLMSLVTVEKTMYFTVLCQDDKWVAISTSDFATRKVCADSTVGLSLFPKTDSGEVRSNYKYYCALNSSDGSYEWNIMTKCGDDFYWTGNSMCDSRDSTIYPIVKIGEQTWMAKNLNYHYVEKTYKGKDADTSSYCLDDNPVNCEKYGRLYIWSAAMDSAANWSKNGAGCGYYVSCSITSPVRGICPSGWHLPDTTEWNTLFGKIGSDVSAFMAKNTGNTDWDKVATDENGFSALPGGMRYRTATYNSTGAHFISATPHEDSTLVYDRMILSYGEVSADTYSTYRKRHAYSVRCVKD